MTIDLSKSQIIHGDCLNVLSGLNEASVDLVFADPPFNIGYRYDGYDDAKKYDDYVGWTRQWMTACSRVLKPDGSMYIAIGDAYAAEVRVLGRQLGLPLRNWIIWHYNFGQNMRRRFSLAHTHIFYFVKDEKLTPFHDEAVRFPSARHTEYSDRRAHPLGRVPDDVWDEFPRLCGTFKEREGWHGCQMPESILMRIIRASSRAGDVVLDPFSGSGTTASAAAKLGRIAIGIDQSEEYAAHGQKRLKAALAECAAQPAPLAGEQGPLARPDRDGELEPPARRERVAKGRHSASATADVAPSPADSTRWTEPLREALRQLYRETETPRDNLTANDVAMTCFAGCFAVRTGCDFTPGELTAELCRLDETNQLPRFKNDRPYYAKKHRMTEHAGDRKLKIAWFAGLDDKRRNENNRAALELSADAAPAQPVDPVEPGAASAPRRRGRPRKSATA